MARTINHEIKLDGVELSVYGYYYEGDLGDYLNPPEPEEFQISFVYLEDIDITDLIYCRLDEIEELIIEENYR